MEFCVLSPLSFPPDLSLHTSYHRSCGPRRSAPRCPHPCRLCRCVVSPPPSGGKTKPNKMMAEPFLDILICIVSYCKTPPFGATQSADFDFSEYIYFFYFFCFFVFETAQKKMRAVNCMHKMTSSPLLSDYITWGSYNAVECFLGFKS